MLIIGCGDAPTDPIHGSIDGVPFSGVGAIATIEGGVIYVTVANEILSCDVPYAPSAHLLAVNVSIPAHGGVPAQAKLRVGTSYSLAATSYHADSSTLHRPTTTIASDGALYLDEIRPVVRAGLRVDQSSLKLEGTFAAPLCSPTK
jgi:hypothetical protein